MSSVAVTHDIPRERVFVSRSTAAEMLSVSQRTIERAERSGELQSFRVGRRVVIHMSDLMSFARRVPN